MCIVEKLALLAHWRPLTAHLLRDTYDDGNDPSSDDRQGPIDDLVAKLSAVLEPLATSNRTGEADRRSGLKALVKRAANLQYVLFKQPTEWEMLWTPPRNEQGVLVVFPELRRTSDEKGKRLTSPQSQTAAQVVEI